MLTNLKKLLALSSAVALVAMNLIPAGVSAAAVNDAVAALSTGNITLTSASITGATATVRVEKDGVVVPGVTATVAGTVITVVDPDGTSDSALATGYYVITFNTDTGDFGSATFDNSSTYNKVVVSATVVPTLSLSLVNNNSALGVLSPGVFSATPVSVDLTYSTNAKNGLTVAMASTGLKDTAANHEINATKISAVATNDGLYTFATASGSGAATVNATSTGVALTQTVASTSAPVNAAVRNVKVGAQITNTTVSGNYTDTLTFTVTGTF